MFYKQRHNIDFGYFQIKNEKIAQYILSDLPYPQSNLIKKNIFLYNKKARISAGFYVGRLVLISCPTLRLQTQRAVIDPSNYFVASSRPTVGLI
ncbi:hypothetical protein D3C80_751340 [compost metagenome]